MAYGTIKVDNITFTNNSVDKTVSLSGLIQNPTFTGNVTATGTISGDVIRGGTTISGVTVTGTTANFVSGVFTTQISGVTIIATTGTFTSLTGTTTTGTTANFVSGVFTTQVSGTTITGTTVATTTGSFVSLTGTTATFTSGIIASGTAALPSLAILSDPNTGIYSPGADQLAIATGGTRRIIVDASGNVNIDSNTLYVDAVNNRLGIGTTSPTTLLHLSKDSASAGFGVYPAIQVVNPNAVGYAALYLNESTATAGIETRRDTAHLAFLAGNAERARIDSSGRLLVGTSTSGGRVGATLQIAASGAGYLFEQRYAESNASGADVFLTKSRGTIASPTVVSSGDNISIIRFSGYDGASYLETATIASAVDGTPGSNDMPGCLVFSTTADGAASPTERMRIDSTGKLVNFAATSGIGSRSATGAGTTEWLFAGNHSATNTAAGTGTNVFLVYTNGNVVNTNGSYGTISDAKLKENIVDANSQWDDLKALQVRNYNFKKGQTHTQIGLVAQEAELVSPGLVSESLDRDEEGNDLGTVTKSVNLTVLYMKAVKALQEAMERVETLEARLTAAGIE